MNTPGGKQASANYNASIRSYTMRYAIADMLQKPSYFFKDVIKQHFRLKSELVLEQMREWKTSPATADIVRIELEKLEIEFLEAQDQVLTTNNNTADEEFDSNILRAIELSLAPRQDELSDEADNVAITPVETYEEFDLARTATTERAKRKFQSDSTEVVELLDDSEAQDNYVVPNKMRKCVVDGAEVVSLVDD
jgi:hypothetical protein